MAVPKSPKCLSTIFLSLTVFAIFAPATLANIPQENVTDLLIQKALDSLNHDSPNHNTYKSCNLISAQKLSEPPYVIYRLTLNLEPKCNEETSCPREACAIDLRQHELGNIDVQRNSIQCMYLYPQSDQAETQQQTIQDVTQDNNSNNQEQDTKETFDKSTDNSSVQLDHEVQTVTDGIDRPFIAVRAIDRKYCAGCPYELNPELPGLAAYSEQVAQSMDENGSSEFKRKVVRIVRVTRAVPPGSNVIIYELLLQIGQTNCPKNDASGREDCSLLANVPIEHCLVTFEQRPWQRDSRKIVRNNCTDLPDSFNEVRGNADEASETSDVISASATGSKDDIVSNARIDENGETADNIDITPTASSMIQEDPRLTVTETTVRKIVIVDNNDEGKIEGFANRNKEFDDFLKAIDFDGAIKNRVPEPVDPRTPVNEEIIRPVIVVRKNSNGNCDEERRNVERTIRSIIDTTKDEKEFVHKLAQKVVDELDEIDGDDEKRVLLEVIDSRKQLTRDKIYFVKMRVAKSDCHEGTKDCSADNRESVKICKAQIQTRDLGSHETAKVLQSQCFDEPKNRDERSKRHSWPQPWSDEDKPEMIIEPTRENSVKRVRRSQAIVGGVTPTESDDPKIQEYVKLGLSAYAETFGADNEPYLIKIVDSSKQVVSGMLYKIRVRLGESTCPRGANENCQLKSDREAKDYEITAWSRPWLDDKKLDIKIKVYTEKNKVYRRSLRGKNYSEKMLKLSKTLEEERAFEDFVQFHRKTYRSDEERDYRFSVFRKNMKFIDSLRDGERGTAHYGATIFADLTPDEFRTKHLGLRQDLRSDNAIPLPMAVIPNIELPREFDWRHRNVVTEVKNQGSCGSCWAFSVTGNVESLNAIKHGKLLSLSEQELVDCDKLDSGCNGGLPDNAYRAIEEIGGLELETDYPYDGEDEKCHFDNNKVRVSVVSGLNITSNETQMAQWLVENGPISIGINANAMQFYMGGISHPFKFLCSGDNLDHGVLIVGFGIHKYPIFKKEMPYWIIKNSWGPNWGEQGYYRVYRGDGTCGVNRMATSAVIA